MAQDAIFYLCTYCSVLYSSCICIFIVLSLDMVIIVVLSLHGKNELCFIVEAADSCSQTNLPYDRKLYFWHVSSATH